MAKTLEHGLDLAIDRYRVDRLLGQGAMGKVYLGHDPKLDRPVAIKVMNAQADDTSRNRFRLEAKTIATIRHPNIVELYDYSGASAQDLYLVMEYLPGRSLERFVREHGPMSETTALCVAHELALALEHAHAANIIHRDIKPENVILTAGRVVLTDFGIVKAVTQRLTQAHSQTQVLGTPGFMAPEQFEGRKLDGRTDIFGVGATLYFLTNDQLPYEGKNVPDILRSLRQGRYRDPRINNPLLSDGFCEVLRRCLAAKPKDRYPDAAALLEGIQQVIRAQGVGDVRRELADYEKNPAQQAIAQRERNIDMLVRDLKVALKDHNRVQARAIVQRMQTLGPLDSKRLEVSGIRLDADMEPVFDLEPRGRRAAWWFVGGLTLGLGLGTVLGAVLFFYRIVPREWLLLVEQAEEWLRVHAEKL